MLGILHNPRYAGAYVFGRTRQRKVRSSGQARYRRLPRDEWKVFLPDAYPGYITWEQFEANQEALRASAQCIGADRRRSAPREGVALLQGARHLRSVRQPHDCRLRRVSRSPGAALSLSAPGD